ncbi:MAG: efflux transporter periplasmic adaptor subunit, partial [Planctomycetota bacterium]
MNASTHPHPAPRALRALFLAVAVAAVGLGVAALLRPDPIRAEIGSVDRGPVSVWVRDAGRTRIRDRFTVHAPRDGILVRPDWKVGDAVRAG